MYKFCIFGEYNKFCLIHKFQTSLQQPILTDEYGRPYKGRARIIKLMNGIKVDISNSHSMTKQICDQFIKQIHSLVPWHKNFAEIPKTIWRNIKCIVILMLRCCCDGQMTEQWNEFFHATSVPENEVSTVNQDTPTSLRSKYNLHTGQRYWHQSKQLMLTCTGDGYPASNTPRDVSTITAGIVKIHVYNHENLHQTLLIGSPFIISGLKHSNYKLINLYHRLVHQLGNNGGLSFYSTRAKCCICVDYYVYHNGDWPFLAELTLRVFGHNAKYPFIYWLHYNNGKFEAVSTSLERGYDVWFEAIKAGIKEKHMPWNLDFASINEGDNFFCLCTETIWKTWQDNIENFIHNIKNLHLLTRKTVHDRRTSYARTHKQCVLYKTPNILVQWIIDVLHFMLRHGINITCALTILCFCSFQFGVSETVQVLSHCCMFFILFMCIFCQTQEYFLYSLQYIF